MPSRAGTFASSFALISACASSGPRTPAPPQPSPAALQVVSPPGELAASTAPRAPESSPAAPPRAPLALAARSCTPADWSARKLEQLLTPGSRGNPAYSDRAPVETPAFEAECTDAPYGPSGTGAPVIIDGVALELAGVSPAGVSGRHWSGNQCRFRLR